MRIATFACSLLIVACSSSAEPTASASQATPPAAAPAAPPAAAPAAAAPAAAAPAPTEAPKAGGLTWEAPAPLVRQAPKSSMRAAQYTVEGDDRAELAVFYFGNGQGGGIEDNITRWLGQFKQPDGSDTTAKAKRSEKKVGEVSVALVEASGVYGGGMAMPGTPQAEPIQDAALLAAIAQGPEGSLFFKLVGPREAVERARPAFDALITSIKKAP